jgi:hypothetical protein
VAGGANLLQEPNVPQANSPKLTVGELAIAEKVGLFLIPTVREMVANMKPAREGATATFCREFAALRAAKAVLPDSAPPMTRIDLDLKMLDLASAFVDAQSKA